MRQPTPNPRQQTIDQMFARQRAAQEQASREVITYSRDEFQRGRIYTHSFIIRRSIGFTSDPRDSSEVRMKQVVDLLLDASDKISYTQNIKYQFRITITDKNGRILTLSYHSSDSKDGAIQNMLSGINNKLYAYDHKIMNITAVHLIVWEFMEGGRGADRQIKQATEKWTVLSSKSKVNCLYHAFCQATKEYTDPRKLEQDAKDLKKRVKPTAKETSTHETIQELANHKKTQINLYNYRFDLVLEALPGKLDKRTKPRDPVNLQIINNHYVALVPKRGEDKFLSRPESDGLIRVFGRGKVGLNEKFAAWDVEATNDDDGVQVPYMCGIAWVEDGTQRYQKFEGLDCITQFFIFLQDPQFAGYTLYAHNSGKYDTIHLFRSYLLLNVGLWSINHKKSVCNEGRWLRLTVQGPHILKFQDSWALIGMPLKKACIEFDVPHQKLEETVKHDEINLANWHTYEPLALYLEHDCRGLLEVLQCFALACHEASNGTINIVDCLTAATYAKKNFFNCYYRRDYPIYQPPKEVDDFIRKSYFGGRNEIFVKPGTRLQSLFYDDYTSLYPSESRRPLPYGQAEYVESVDIDHFFGFVRCMVRTVDTSRKPLHGIKCPKTKRLLFPIFENWTELTLFSEEIKLGMVGPLYEYRLMDGYRYNSACILKQCMEDAVARKAEARAAGKDGLASVYKVIANSTYGFWALNTHDRESCIVGRHDEVDVLKYLQEDRLLDITQTDHYTSLKVVEDISVKDTCIAIASAITSWSRMRLWSLITAIEAKGGEVYYCDTDSVIHSINVDDHPDLLEEFKWDRSGKELGSLKDEAEEAVEKHFTKKIRKQHKYKDTQKTSTEHKQEIARLCSLQPTRSFDSGVIAGLKFYSLQKTLHDGSKVEINKLKGGNAGELSHDDYLTKSCMEQEQTQFRCGVQGYISQDFGIRVGAIPKRFEMQYTKGVVQPDTHMLAPLRL